MENEEDINNENPSYFAIIPAEIRYDKDLKDKAKLLYGEITCLSNKKGYCYASNTYFADLYGVSKETISRLITDLVDKGYVTREVVYKKGTKEIINRYIKISQYPIDKNVKTLLTKKSIPIDEKVKENNTSINNININNTSINNTSNNSCCCNINLDISQEVIEFYNNNIGMLTPYQYEILNSFKEDGIEDDLIIYAMKKACEIDNKNIAYIKGILNSWLKKGITTLIEAQKENEKFQNNKKPKEETIEERAKRLEKMMEEEK